MCFSLPRDKRSPPSPCCSSSVKQTRCKLNRDNKCSEYNNDDADSDDNDDEKYDRSDKNDDGTKY